MRAAVVSRVLHRAAHNTNEFARYINDRLMDVVCMRLGEFEKYTVCAAAVGVVGDLCRAVEGAIVPYASKVVGLLLSALSVSRRWGSCALCHELLPDGVGVHAQSARLHRSVKPPAIGVFGDIAMSIGSRFAEFMPFVMNMLISAGQTTVPVRAGHSARGWTGWPTPWTPPPAQPDDEDLIEYLNELRLGILEAFTGITQGLNGDEDQSQCGFRTYALLQKRACVRASCLPPACACACSAAAGAPGAPHRGLHGSRR